MDIILEIPHAAGPSEPVLQFAGDELHRFLSGAGDETKSPETGGTNAPSLPWRISLSVDPALPPFEFGYRVEDSSSGPTIHLHGQDAPCVLHAAYTFLERLGFRFEITGPVAPAILHIEPLIGKEELIQPYIHRRGIRQHLNFPMDISSYPLEEAQEYIRNLARLRFNCITFHSYANQWTAFPWQGQAGLAGFFFYGQRHDVPQVPMIRGAVRNQHVFCIPEIEPYFEDWEERSRRAVAWLQAVMAEAKRVGLSIQFSFEPRRSSLDISETLRECAAILKTYPSVDTLELITQETGGWGEAAPAGRLVDIIAEHFGPEALELEAVKRVLLDGQRDLDRLFGEIGHNVRAVNGLLQDPSAVRRPRLCLGVYCVTGSYLPAGLALLRRSAPQEVELALLPGHGSRQVDRNVSTAGLTTADRQRTTLYSWLEFDGLMYLQQNAIPGIQALLEGGAFHALLFNHWRTAENRAAARYASLACIHGPMSEEDFYLEDARGLEIHPPEAWAAGLNLVALADGRATTELPNVGFCYVGVWGVEGLGAFAWWEVEKLGEIRGLYEAAGAKFRSCLRRTHQVPGREAVALLLNRVGCTILYLRAIQSAAALQPLIGSRPAAGFSPQERQEIRRICNASLSLLRQTLRLHARTMPDRGCEGTLLSLFYTPMSVLRRIRHQFGGGAPDRWPVRYESADAPPLPIEVG